ncbi:hypothetical protein DSM25558_4725 [Agrobacterium sp. DSM 25558]|nr:hypothetical protein DSM25558_4725 [Agrobacterium sp. DSM 25558]
MKRTLALGPRMKIKHYIVTYKNDPMLAQAIESIFRTDTDHERQVFVIANHSADRYEGPHPVVFLRNETRPDFSTGHLSRNWNQALIAGFVDLRNPSSDLLILSQNDCIFAPDYLEPLVANHEKYDLVTYGAGDSCISYSAAAVRRIGLWDERFCNIGYQEADYFLRAAKYHGPRVSINDGYHGRLYNALDTVENVITSTPSGFERNDASHIESSQYHRQSRNFFAAKWGVDYKPQFWGADFLKAEIKLNGPIFYPYFENAIETLQEQKYLAFF